MKVTKRAVAKLANNNLAEVKQWAKTPLADTPYFALVALLADMCDTIAKGTSAYVVIGATSSNSAFSITLNAAGDKDSRYGPSFADTATGAQDWL